MILVLVAGLPILTAAVAVLMRALRRRDDRRAWLALGAAVLAEAIGAIWVAWPGGETRFPSHADVVLLTFFPLVFVAALLFARRRLVRITPALWLDAAIGSVGAAAIVAQLLGETAQRATGGGWQSVVALLYPMFDVLLVVMVLVAVTLRGWRVSSVWLLIGAGLLAHVAADVGYAWAGFAGERRPLWVPLLGLLSPVLIAVAALRPAELPRKVALAGWRTLVTPSVMTLVAGGLLVADHFNPTSTPAVLLSAATLVLALGRMALTFLENTALQHSRALALTDELTGLANRRAFHEQLRAELRENSRLAVAMVDLDRFKDLNDTLGHHAGDLLLINLGARLQGGGRKQRAGGPPRRRRVRAAVAECRARAGGGRRAPHRRRAASAVRDRRARSRDGRQHRRRAVPRPRLRRRRAAAARGRRHVPGQGRPHRLPDLRPVA